MGIPTHHTIRFYLQMMVRFDPSHNPHWRPHDEPRDNWTYVNSIDTKNSGQYQTCGIGSILGGRADFRCPPRSGEGAPKGRLTPALTGPPPTAPPGLAPQGFCPGHSGGQHGLGSAVA